MVGCPPVEQLRGFASGILSDDQAAAIESHVGTCVSCRSSMASLAKGSNNNEQVAPDADARIGKRLGRYRVDRVLGMGGMGIVYAAWDPQLDRPVAIKVVHRAAADAAGRARLVREAQSLARLSHTNVCHVYDVGTEPAPDNPEGDVWVAMEMIDGTTLREWATGKSQDEIMRVLLGAGEGIAAAHGAGLIHRDIKPENVLVTRASATAGGARDAYRPVVTDFGLARLDLPVDPSGATAALDPLKTATNAIVGTPAYLAPEQLTGGTLDARVDQFAWAVMAWELLAGVRPFPAIPIVRLEAIIAGPKPHPSLGKPLAQALAKAMQAAPRDRYGSMRELMEAVKPAGTKRGGRGVMFAVAGGAAVVAVAATVIVWKLATPAEQAPPIAATPPPPVTAPQTPSNPTPIAPPIPAPPETAPLAEGSGAKSALVAKANTPKVETSKPAVAKIATPPKPEKSDLVARTELEVTKSKRVPGPPTPVPAPTPPEPENPPDPAAQKVPAGALEAYLARHPYDKSRAVAVLDAFCRIPVDAAKPGPEPGRHGVADWGKVTRRELGVLRLGNRSHHAPLYEVKGFRGTYRFTADHWENTVGVMDARVGQWVVLCVDQMSDLYDLPPGWQKPLATLSAMVPVSRPPRVDEIAKWNPLHISDLALRRDGGYGKTSLDTSRRYLLRAKLEAHEGGIRWDMSKWWLDVPANVPGANLVATGKRLWFVVEDLKFEEQADGSPPRLVVRALAVVDDLFP